VQDRIPYWWAPLKDEKTGRWITSHTVNQDFVGWVGQGAIADRTKEHLGESDRGIILLRRRMLEEARKVEQGLDPKAILRDPAQNECIPLPTIGLEAVRTGRPIDEFLQGQARFRRPGMKMGELVWFAHQPEEIRQQWLDAMGVEARTLAAEKVGAGDGAR
jgi:5,5'-dehydrodivanillate O-demethylase